MREGLAKHLDHDPDFEWRGQNVTRIENLSDIVFALALGMLLLTGTPPQTFSELVAFLINIVPVTAGFAILFVIWNAHFVFFRRYGLADNQVVLLNAALLLMVLFIAYPLRFIFDGLFGYIIGSITNDFSRLDASDMLLENSARSMAIFGAGYAIIFTLLSFMYAHALSKADVIGLSAKERLITRQTVLIFRLEVLIALCVFAFALFTPLGPFSGFLMVLNWPAAILVTRVTTPSKPKLGSTD
ncbi:MAG: TMEM175 family protein [Pseudomonadota bacterium]